MGNWYDRDKVLASFARNGFDRDMTAKEFGCHPTTVSVYARQAAMDAGKPWEDQRSRSALAKGPPQIRWNKDSIAKLIAILERRPLPNNAAIAAEMGISKGALQTAMSRFNLASHARSENVTARSAMDQRPQSNRRRVRPCMNCDRPFGSEHIGHRLCLKCGGMGSVNQETSYA